MTFRGYDGRPPRHLIPGKVSMNYSILCDTLAQDCDGVVFDVSSLYSRLLRLTDHRRRRGVRYQLAALLTAVVVAKLAGQDKPDGLAEWIKLRADFFTKVFQLKRAFRPHAMTYRRVLANTALAGALDTLVREYLLSEPQAGQSVQIALDGKTLRGTMAAEHSRALHLLAAYLPEEGVVLMQAEVAGHTNEIPVAPQVLKVLDLQGKIITGDALLAQRMLSTLIVEAGGDYVWTVKDNQPQLRHDIGQLFQPETCLPGTSPVITEVRSTQTVEKSHGRLTTRRLTACSVLRESSDWPYLQQVFKIERRSICQRTGATQTETAYGVTSLTATQASPARLLQLNRGHWGIENGLHYRRDVTLGEDAGRTTAPALGHTMAALNNLVIGLTIGRGWRNLAKARRYFDAHPEQAFRLLFARPSLTL
jgi:predicted transposase YbfD/YdcC